MRWLLLALPLGLTGALLAAVPSFAEAPTIEAIGSVSYAWKPSSAEVGQGGAVTFKNSTGIPHGVTWTGGPETPTCSGVPIDAGKTSWSGSCTFAQAGTYAFECSVHPTEMRGTVSVVSSGTTASPPPPPAGESPPPPGGPPAESLRIAQAQRGVSVRGSLQLSDAAAGGKLEVDLLAARASLLGAGKRGAVRVGKLLRSSLQAGPLAFLVPLGKPARRALRRRGNLRLTVRVVVTPLHAKAMTLRRGVLIKESR